MLLAAVILLQALQDGQIEKQSGGRLWLELGRAAGWVSPDQPAPGALPPSVCLSPLLGLTGSTVQAGESAWLRLSCLEAGLSGQILSRLLPALGSEITLGGLRWGVQGCHTQSQQHSWAGQTTYESLIAHHLIHPHPPRRWQVEFETPSLFQVYPGRYPLPDAAGLFVRGLEAWLAYGPLALPAGLDAILDGGLRLGLGEVYTLPVSPNGRLGCLGRVQVSAPRQPVKIRAALDLLAALAFYTGCGLPLQDTWAPVRTLALPAGKRSSHPARWQWWQEPSGD